MQIPNLIRSAILIHIAIYQNRCILRRRDYTNDVAALFVVATPIGNLQDITLRALDVLSSVHVVAAEDTRSAQRLLAAHGISKKLIRCDAHSEAASADGIVALLAQNLDVAYTSDAGTPGFSDPGGKLVARVREAGYEVVPIPGVSALTTLVSVCGRGAKGVYFEGFLSPKSGRRRKRLAELRDMGVSFVLFESPFRILKLLSDLADVCPERWIFAGREMTKLHEEFLEGTATEIRINLSNRSAVKGEFCILVVARKND